MSIEVFLMVLGAALVHAVWNALVKSDEDRLGLIKMMFATQFAVSVCLLPFVAVPARESWPYLCASAVLGTGYMLFLTGLIGSGTSATFILSRVGSRRSSWRLFRSGSWASRSAIPARLRSG
jgi:hypothetical protein